jgi:hypothetical protein
MSEGWERYQVAADGAYGEEISLPAPLNFSLTTATWPRWKKVRSPGHMPALADIRLRPGLGWGP